MCNRYKITGISLVILFFCSLIQPVFSAEPVTIMTDAKAQEIVAKAINDLKVGNKYGYREGGYDNRYYIIPFSQLTEIAVAMDKCKTISDETSKELITLMTEKDPKSMQWLKGLKLLLADDMSGVKDIFGNKYYDPLYKDMLPAIATVSKYGYPLAENVLKTLKREEMVRPSGHVAYNDAAPEVKERIIAWMSIPQDKRKVVDEIMLNHYPPGNFYYRRRLIDDILKMSKNHTPGQYTSDDYFSFAMWLGKETLSMSDVIELYYNGKDAKGAIKLAKGMAKGYYDDEALQLNVAKTIISFHAPSKEIIDFFQDLFINCKEPYIRDCRVYYFEEIKKERLKPDVETLATIQQEEDLLRAGDAFIVDANYEKATEKFCAVLNDINADVYHHAAAWSGLLDSDPAKAMEYADNLLNDVEGIKNVEARGKLVVWLGWQLNRVVNREVPMLTGAYSRLQYKPIHDINNWQKLLAIYMEKLLKIDAVACLQPGKNYSPSLRYTAALIYALDWQNNKAGEIAKREIKYIVLPPSGGWQFDPENRDLDLEKPREKISPRALETELLMQELMPALVRYNVKMQTSPVEPINMPLPNLELMGFQCSMIDLCKDKVKDKDFIISTLKSFGEQFYLAIVFLDPKRTNMRTDQPAPPTREVNLEQMVYLRARLNIAFDNELACKYAPYFLHAGDSRYRNEYYGGMLKAMFEASSPALLKEMFRLTEEILDKYQKVEGPEKAAKEAEYIANYITARQIYDMSEYATGLRARYPKPEIKK